MGILSVIKLALIGLAALFVLIILLIAISDISFNKRVEKEMNILKDEIPGTQGQTFTYDDIEGLPEPVQRYFKYSIKEGQAYIQFARLEHTGSFRMDVGRDWYPVEGKECFTADVPAFIWYGKVKMNPLVWVKARDKYHNGTGNMLIKLQSTIKIADEQGRELSQSDLVRWLGEAPFFPTALLPGKDLRWEEIDSDSARVIVEDHGLHVSGVFYFNEKGQITRFLTHDRFRTVDYRQVNDPFNGYYRDYQEYNGFMIPTEIEAVWDLDEGNFSYAKFKVEDIQYEFYDER